MKNACALLCVAILVAETVNGFTATGGIRTPRTSSLSLQGVQSSASLRYQSSISMALEKHSNRFNIFKRSKTRSASSISSSAAMDFNTGGPSSPKKRIMNLFEKVRSNEVMQWRIAAAVFLTSIITFESSINVQLIKFWHWLQTSSSLIPTCFRHDHWEWQVAIWAFFVWIHGFWMADRAVAKADAKGLVHPWKKHRLQDQYEAEKHRRMHLRKLENGEDMTDTDAKPPATKQAKWHLGFWLFELPLYVLPLYAIDKKWPRRAPKIAARGAPTALGICADVTTALFLYDFFFFVFHYIFHKVPFLYKYVHKKHHASTEVRASDIVRLSFVEEIVDVGISILVLNNLKAHPVSRTIYNVIITFLLVELHSGFAFPWTPQFVVPFGLATGSKGHHYHHRNGNKYYQKFFCHVDKLFGFVQKPDSTMKGFSVAMK